MRRSAEWSDGWEIRPFAPFERIDAERLRAMESEAERGEWLPASVPGQVHDILRKAGVIDDPELPGQGEACRWVSGRDWVYRRTFAHCRTEGKTYVHFLGLDTIVDVYLNGLLVASHCDMYLPLRVEITHRLQEQNTLLLHFHSPLAHIRSHPLPQRWAGKIQPHRIIRKAEHDFTGYLGNKQLVAPIGVYDKVLLETIDGIELLEADVDWSVADDHSSGMVRIRASGTGEAERGALLAAVRDPSGNVVAERLVPLPEAGGSEWTQSFEMEVAAPRLWWPRGFGEQPLYTVAVSAVANGEERDRIEKSIGFRTVKMKRPFHFEINGREMTLWGAQTAPLSGSTHCWNREKAGRILDLAEQCNMNALRIWGGSDRYDDEFYEEADRRGLLLWQEFFHDYGMYPDDPEYRELCRREAEFQVKRLKHHPSILFWCGGNECFMGGEYDFPGEPYIGAEIFAEDYARVCRELDPDRYFHLNSPSGGAFANDPLAGDTHSYTNTWYVPGADVPVMIAEEIRTSPPSVKSLLKYLGEKRAWPENYSGLVTRDAPYPWPDSWTELTSAQGWRKIPPIEQFYDSNDLESAVYKFGAAHGKYLRNILENNRRGKPAGVPEGERICRGHFVCRWNDSWPILYGSMLDYYLEPYIPYYAVKRAYEPLLLSFEIGNFIWAWIVNDTPEPAAGTLYVRLFDPEANRFVRSIERKVEVMPGESKRITDLNAFKQFSRQWLLYAELVGANGERLARTNDYVDIERHLRFPEARLSLELAGDTLLVTTDRFARCVELSGDADGDAFGWLFEDNYFDVFPGETKAVRVSGKHTKGQIAAKPYYSPYTASIDYNKER